MTDEAEIHRMANSADVEERRTAVEQLRDNFAYFSDKDAAWAYLIQLIQDEDSEVRRNATRALGSCFSAVPDKDIAWSDLIRFIQNEDSSGSFCIQCEVVDVLVPCFFDVPDKYTAWSDLIWLASQDKDDAAVVDYALIPCFSAVPDKDTAWSDLIRLTQNGEGLVPWNATRALGSVFNDMSDKDTAWSDLHRLTQDEDVEVRWGAALALNSCFSDIPDKDTAWSDLHWLTQDTNRNVRSNAAITLNSCFLDIPDKDSAWSDLHRLTQDGDEEVRRNAAGALGSCFSAVPDEDTAWVDLHRLTLDENSGVRMYAYHSLGSISVYKATATEDGRKFREELKKAIDFFEKSSQEAKNKHSNPAQFCLPFYRSYYAIISEKQEAEAEAVKYLDEAKKATGRSESKEALLKAVENLANALKEAQKPLNFGETKEHLRACRQYCDHTAKLADSARGKSPVAAAAIMRGIPIVGVKIKEIIAEIQEKAKDACQQAQGTPTEEIACAVNREVQKWRIDDQEEMTQKVENIVFCLKSKIPENTQNKNIHEKIEEIRGESNMTKQYEMVSILIALISTASVHTGDVINADVTASGESQVVVKGNENKNANDNVLASKKSLLERISNPATIAAFVGFLCAEIGTYFYPVTYNHLISVGIACLAFIIVAIFNKE